MMSAGASVMVASFEPPTSGSGGDGGGLPPRDNEGGPGDGDGGGDGRRKFFRFNVLAG